jgi:hypothetical protein
MCDRLACSTDTGVECDDNQAQPRTRIPWQTGYCIYYIRCIPAFSSFQEKCNYFERCIFNSSFTTGIGTGKDEKSILAPFLSLLQMPRYRYRITGKVATGQCFSLRSALTCIRIQLRKRMRLHADTDFLLFSQAKIKR